MTIALNPGFALLLGALAAFAAPRAFRGAIMIVASVACVWLILTPPFGAYDTFAQIGLEVVLLRLDAHSQIFGLAFAIGAILTALATRDRRDRTEDTAIFLMAGGATTAVFAGDLISFVAATELASIAGAGIVLSAGGQAALRAGVRFLIWQGLGGLLLLAGVAFHLADGFDTTFGRLPADSVGGAVFLAGLAIKAGAPLVHVWIKDALAHASPVGAAALSIFSVELAIYALARGYSGEAMLAPVGVAMAIGGALYALSEDDLRRALSYSLMSQLGLIIAAIGVGRPLALAGAAAHAFTTTLAYALLFMAIGAVMVRTGRTRASELGGLNRTMPLTSVFAIMGGLSAASAPGFAGYVSETLAIDAIARDAPRDIWFALTAAGAASAAFAAVRFPAAIFFGPQRAPAAHDAPFSMLLAMALAAFLCAAIGLAPGWLLAMLPPSPIAYNAYSVDRIAPHLQLLAAAMAAYAALRWLRLTGEGAARDMRDIDAFYGGPLAQAARWCGVVLLRLYGGAKSAADTALRRTADAFAELARATDRPFASGTAVLGQLSAILIVLCLLYVFAT